MTADVVAKIAKEEIGARQRMSVGRMICSPVRVGIGVWDGCITCMRRNWWQHGRTDTMTFM